MTWKVADASRPRTRFVNGFARSEIAVSRCFDVIVNPVSVTIFEQDLSFFPTLQFLFQPNTMQSAQSDRFCRSHTRISGIRLAEWFTDT